MAVISEISLDINYAALLHHQPFLNALDVRNAQLIFPIETNDPRSAQSAADTLPRARLFSAGTDLRQPGRGNFLRRPHFGDRPADQAR